jgi:heme/copper-type cytochrome/quinol oxidase subunit 3
MRTRLGRLRQKDTRRLFATLLAGKMLGIAAVLGAVKALTDLVGTPAAAATPVQQVAHQANDLINPMNTLWVLITAFLVFRWWEFKALNTRWDSNAYASAAWNVLGFHATLIVLEWGEVVGFLALMLLGPVEGKHFVDAAEVAGYWYFLIGSWVPLYVMVFLSPYLV